MNYSRLLLISIGVSTILLSLFSSARLLINDQKNLSSSAVYLKENQEQIDLKTVKAPLSKLEKFIAYSAQQVSSFVAAQNFPEKLKKINSIENPPQATTEETLPEITTESPGITQPEQPQEAEKTQPRKFRYSKKFKKYFQTKVLNQRPNQDTQPSSNISNNQRVVAHEISHKEYVQKAGSIAINLNSQADNSLYDSDETDKPSLRMPKKHY